MILSDLNTYLTGFVSVTDLIDDRIYVKRAPQGTATPYVLIGRVSGDTGYALDGELGTNTTIIQITVWDRGPNGPFKASRIEAAIRNVLSGFQTGLWGTRWINACTLTGEPTELYDEAGDGSDNGYHGVAMDFRVTHSAAIPTLS